MTTPKPKRVKLTRNTNSIRPGSTSQSDVETRWLALQIPSLLALGTDEETTLVRELAIQIAAMTEVGVVKKFGIRSGMWEILVALPTPDQGDDDALLTKTFLALKAVMDESKVLQEGFSAINAPRWSFSIGNFVADNGLFK